MAESNIWAGSPRLNAPFICLILFISATAATMAQQQQQQQQRQQVDDSFYERPGVRSAEILRARGFLAEEKYFTTADGYVIRLTRGLNPLINGGRRGLASRVPILFVHGILEADNVFVVNSFGARPRDLSALELADGGAEAERLAADLAAGEPSARSLPLLALNFGHEIWLMSRRGFAGSQQLQLLAPPLDGASFPAPGDLKAAPPSSARGPIASGLASLLGLNLGSVLQQVPFSFDRKFWNFSFDEQARHDFPQAVDFVLAQTGRPQVSVVGHSAGGAIELMALSLRPELANKIHSSILWAQGFTLGHNDAFSRLGPGALALLEAYVGSVPPAFATGELQALGGLFCASQLGQASWCAGVADAFLGASAGQQPMRPEFINSLLYASSSHELAQNLQMLPRGQMCAYNYGPPYNASAIKLARMSFYAGATDATVSAEDVRATLPLLRVPYRFHLIDTAFNHNGYFYHRDNARLAILPALREIHQFSRQTQAAAQA